MAYTDIDDPSAHFHTQIWTGNSGYDVNVVNNANAGNFKPDLIWAKDRVNAYNHNLVDSSRGVTKTLWSDTNAAEMTASQSNYDTKSFNTNGFTTQAPEYTNSLGGNNNANGKVGWQWKANGGTVTTTPNGTQTTNNMQMATKHQINSDAGFSICTYQGATSYGSFYHGLGVKPDVVIIKSRTDAYDWIVYHSSLSNTHTLYLDVANGGATNTAFFPVEPNTTQVYCKDHNSVFRPNGADSYLAYCWAEKQGYSKFGSYKGNGNADGTFVYTGFKPAWVLIKKSNSSGTINHDWMLYDNKRSPINEVDEVLFPSLDNAESSGDDTDFLSNGFKQRSTGSSQNASGDTYIYMAFAENPFTTSTGVPATAR